MLRGIIVHGLSLPILRVQSLGEHGTMLNQEFSSLPSAKLNLKSIYVRPDQQALQYSQKQIKPLNTSSLYSIKKKKKKMEKAS